MRHLSSIATVLLDQRVMLLINRQEDNKFAVVDSMFVIIESKRYHMTSTIESSIIEHGMVGHKDGLVSSEESDCLNIAEVSNRK